MKCLLLFIGNGVSHYDTYIGGIIIKIYLNKRVKSVQTSFTKNIHEHNKAINQ